MVDSMAESNDQRSDQETACYRDTALRRALNTPPQPKKSDSNGDTARGRGCAAGLSSDAFCGVRSEASKVGDCSGGRAGILSPPRVLPSFPGYPG